MTATQTDRAAQIRFLAEKVTGWQWRETSEGGICRNKYVSWWTKDGKRQAWGEWDPFTHEFDCAGLLRAIPEEKRSEVIVAMQSILCWDLFGASDLWQMLTATPEQRCNAILRAYGYDPA